MAGEYFIGQRNPVSQLASNTFEVVPEAIKVTVSQIEAMDAVAYGEFMRRPGAEAAVNFAYEHRYDPPPAPPEPVAEVPSDLPNALSPTPTE